MLDALPRSTPFPLAAAAAAAGTARVYDTSDYRLVSEIALADTIDTLINDVILTDAAAFFTDSFQSQLYSVRLLWIVVVVAVVVLIDRIKKLLQ